MARDADALAGERDAKLRRATDLLRHLLDQGHNPIVFCRFIPTAHYVAGALRQALGKNVTVEAITGELPPEDREDRVERLGEAPRRVLVCTDCLSEGINLQDAFDAVVHYDLSWNPTRHEQREGRVDRYGQIAPTVRAITFYGQDNPVDGIVIQVLLRKHRTIHSQLGITVPVPMDTNAVTEAIFEGLLIRENAAIEQATFDFAEPQRRELDLAWNAAAEREKKSRTIFAQHAIKIDELARVLEETRAAIGDHRDVAEFVSSAVTSLGGQVRSPGRGDPATTLLLQGTTRALRDSMRLGDDEAVVRVTFDPPTPSGARLVTRTHPLVEGLASYVLQGALDPTLRDTDRNLAECARRCSAIVTADVARRTTLLLLRLRFHLVHRGRDAQEHTLLAEDLTVVGFEGAPARAQWLDPERARALLDASPAHNLDPDQARHHLERITEGLPPLAAHLQTVADAHGERLLDAHRRVRRADARRGIDRGLRSVRVDAHRPDLLGCFVLLPAHGGAA